MTVADERDQGSPRLRRPPRLVHDDEQGRRDASHLSAVEEQLRPHLYRAGDWGYRMSRFKRISGSFYRKLIHN